jgi:hypothetical protein
MIGQIISTWKVENQSQEEYSYLSKVSAGVYVAKLQTNGTLSKKIIP